MSQSRRAHGTPDRCVDSVKRREHGSTKADFHAASVPLREDLCYKLRGYDRSRFKHQELIKLPVISVFYGITIKIFQGDHNPPHIHVTYGEFKAQIEIATGRVIAGRLPPRSLQMVKGWLKLRRPQVQKAWNVAEQFGAPKRIKPLE